MFTQLSFNKVSPGGFNRPYPHYPQVLKCLHDRVLNRVGNTSIVSDLDSMKLLINLIGGASSLPTFPNIGRRCNKLIFLSYRVSQQTPTNRIQPV